MLALRFALLLAVFVSPVGRAAEQEAVRKLQVQVFLNDPARADAKLFVHGSAESLVPLELTAGELSNAQTVVVTGGKLVVHSSPQIDPAKPDASLFASATVADGLKQVIAIIQPRGDDKGPPCGLVLIDSAPSSFPGGESRVVSFTALPLAVQAGEHKIAIAPGKITPVPPVTKVDPFNMAQTDFFFRRGNDWVPFSEAKVKYLDTSRQIYLCYVRPGGKVPALVMLIDDLPPAERQP